MSLDSLEDDDPSFSWGTCIFCRRKWRESSLEIELCPYCLEALRSNSGHYHEVKISMMLKYGEFRDPLLAEAVRMIWEQISQ